jgi:hypothetical protein
VPEAVDDRPQIFTDVPLHLSLDFYYNSPPNNTTTKMKFAAAATLAFAASANAFAPASTGNVSYQISLCRGRDYRRCLKEASIEKVGSNAKKSIRSYRIQSHDKTNHDSSK